MVLITYILLKAQKITGSNEEYVMEYNSLGFDGTKKKS